MKSKQLIYLFIIYFNLLSCISSYIISPKPNQIFKISKIQQNDRSSYFGYSLILRKDSLIVGAPRSNSTLEISNEPGEIYKCSIENSECIPSEFIKFNSDENYPKNQWFGGTITAGNKDTDPIIVCAPRHSTEIGTTEIVMNGICYQLPSNSVSEQLDIIKFAPSFNDQVTNDCLQYEFAQMGFSAYLDQTKNQIIFGAPGAFHWHGNVIMGYDRDLIPRGSCEAPFSYLGYSVSGGNFEQNKKKSYYIAGAPRHLDQGTVEIFQIINGVMIPEKKVLTGTQKYEYFGYSLLTEDLNRDEHLDIIVSAPLHSIGERYDVGAIYIFIKNSDLSFTRSKITPPYRRLSGMRFGTAMTKLGDINQDHFNDIAIAAPFGENGVVYIYYGCAKGLRILPEQILQSPQFLNINKKPVKKFGFGSIFETSSFFGFSLSGGIDIDGNGSNDLIIGAPNSELVFLYLSYPVIFVKATFEGLKDIYSTNVKEIEFKTCIFFISNTTSNGKIQKLKFDITIKSKSYDNRLKFLNSEIVTEKNLSPVIMSDEKNCENHKIIIESNGKNNKRQFELEMKYKLVQEPLTDKFCEECIANDSHVNGIVYKIFSMKNLCNGIDQCLPNLQVDLVSYTNLNHSENKYYLEVGKYENFAIEYEVINSKDQAYMPKINISTNQNILFANIPKFCNEIDSILQCDLWPDDSLVLSKNNSKKFLVTFSTEKIEDELLTVTAEAFSQNIDYYKLDNKKEIEINFIQSSVVEIFEISPPQIIMIDDDSPNSLEVNKTVQIKNLGPSILTDLQIPVSIPISSSNNETTLPELKINLQNIAIIGKYDGKVLPKGRTRRTNEKPLKSPKTKIRNEMLPRKSNKHSRISKRSIQRIKNTNQFEMHPNVLIKDTYKDIITIPINNSNSIGCRNGKNAGVCIEYVLFLKKFESNQNRPIEIKINFTIDLKDIEEMMKKSGKQYFSYKIRMGIEKYNFKPINRVMFLPKIIHAIHDIVFIKVERQKSSNWIYFISFVAAVLIYFLIAFLLYKIGFFKRKVFKPQEILVRPPSIINLQYTFPLEKLKEGFDNKMFSLDEPTRY